MSHATLRFSSLATWESEVQNRYLDTSRFSFFNWKIKIWTCPELKSGRVQIFYFQLKNKNLDASRFSIFKLKIEIQTSQCHFLAMRSFVRPDLFFSNWKIKIWTCPDFLIFNWKKKSGHVQIFWFSMIKTKSGLDYDIYFKMESVRPDWYLSIEK